MEGLKVKETGRLDWPVLTSTLRPRRAQVESCMGLKITFAPDLIKERSCSLACVAVPQLSSPSCDTYFNLDVHRNDTVKSPVFVTVSENIVLH